VDDKPKKDLDVIFKDFDEKYDSQAQDNWPGQKDIDYRHVLHEQDDAFMANCSQLDLGRIILTQKSFFFYRAITLVLVVIF
jgi:hypothetical protein